MTGRICSKCVSASVVAAMTAAAAGQDPRYGIVDIGTLGSESQHTQFTSRAMTVLLATGGDQ